MPFLPSSQPPVTPTSITRSHVLLVEGNDDDYFFRALLRYMQSDQDIQIRLFNGKDNRAIFPAFLNDPGFSLVTSYAIIRDADTNARAALESIQKLLKDYAQPCPPQHSTFAHNDSVTAGIFIMPGNGAIGMLEDLCLQSVNGHPIMPHVDTFMERVRTTMQTEAPKNTSKAKVQAYLAGMKKTVNSLGIAAQNHYWPFDSEAFSPLRQFLTELANF